MLRYCHKQVKTNWDLSLVEITGMLYQSEISKQYPFDL
jgi:hypothetical protein